MANAGLIGLSRQIALHRELEVVANNIANLNTTGYKVRSFVISSFFGVRTFVDRVPRWVTVPSTSPIRTKSPSRTARE